MYGFIYLSMIKDVGVPRRILGKSTRGGAKFVEGATLVKAGSVVSDSDAWALAMDEVNTWSPILTT